MNSETQNPVEDVPRSPRSTRTSNQIQSDELKEALKETVDVEVDIDVGEDNNIFGSESKWRTPSERDNSANYAPIDSSIMITIRSTKGVIRVPKSLLMMSAYFEAFFLRWNEKGVTHIDLPDYIDPNFFIEVIYVLHNPRHPLKHPYVKEYLDYYGVKHEEPMGKTVFKHKSFKTMGFQKKTLFPNMI